MLNTVENVGLDFDLPSRTKPGDGAGTWPFWIDHVSNYAFIQDVFTDAELDAIIRIGESVDLERGTTGGNREGVRDSYVSWLYPNAVTSWVFGKLTDVAVKMNADWFKYDLHGFHQGLQFTNYDAPSGHYTWHIDRGPGHGIRKLSFSVQLSDPDDYEGGDLQLWFGGPEDEVVTAPRERGTIMFFPSYVLHRVTPVTSGTRRSLVAWIDGPPFR